MQYAVIVYSDPGQAGSMSQAEQDQMQAEFMALLDDKRIVQSARLQPAETATSLRFVGGRTLMTDGPFADTKEVLGGFAVVEAANLDDVIELAERIPAARYGGGVEIRPLGQVLRP